MELSLQLESQLPVRRKLLSFLFWNLLNWRHKLLKHFFAVILGVFFRLLNQSEVNEIIRSIYLLPRKLP